MSSSDFAGSVPFGGTCLIMVCRSRRSRARRRAVLSEKSRPMQSFLYSALCNITSSSAAVRPASVRPRRVRSPLSARSTILVASRLVLLASERENVASPLQSHFHVCQRSLVKPFGNRHGCLTSEAGFLCAHGGTMLHVFVGLPRFAKNNPCKSAAFLRMPARFIASVRSTPGFMLRACSSAITASTSRLTLGGGTFFS